ncbi:MAG: hypothetical protein ACRDTE_25870 [Pseudonocardiaceae bacterium]
MKPVEVTLLTQEHCTFCDLAKEVLERVGRDHPLQFREIDLATAEGQRLATTVAALIAQAQWTNGQFARAVNRVGAEAGLQLSYDDSAVCHWLAGTLPRDRVRPVVCEVLSRRLGRPVTPASAGLGTEQYEDTADTVAGLIDLGSADMDPSRRAALGAIGLYSSALVIPG